MSSYFKHYPEEAPIIDIYKIQMLDKEAFVAFVIVWLVIFCMMTKFLKLVIYSLISTLITYWLFFEIDQVRPFNRYIENFITNIRSAE